MKVIFFLRKEFCITLSSLASARYKGTLCQNVEENEELETLRLELGASSENVFWLCQDLGK